jgi:hypothetical protein
MGSSPLPPQHSDALLFLWRRKVHQPELDLWGRTWASRAEHTEFLAQLRRTAAARARARRQNAA